MAFRKKFAFLLLLLPFLVRAEEAPIAESLENTFGSEKIVAVRIHPGAHHPRQIPVIQWDESETRVSTRGFGTSLESILILKGSLQKTEAPRWNVIFEDQGHPLGPRGEVTLEIPFDSDLTTLNLVLVGPTGEVEYHFYSVDLIRPAPTPTPTPIPNPVPAPTLSVQKPAPVPTFSKRPRTEDGEFYKKLTKRFFISPALGLGSLQFSQNDDPSRNWIMMTAKLSANYLIAPPKWDLGFSGFVNLLDLAKSAEPVRFLGLNFRAGYLFPFVRAPWRLALYGGWYYSRMIAENQAFGYRSVSGPQIFPTLRRNLKSGKAWTTYLKLSPIADQASRVSFKNREFALGLGYLMPVAQKTFGVSLDYSNLSLESQGLVISSSSLSLSGSLTF